MKSETAPWEIPACWQWVSASEVAEVVGGGTPPTAEPSYFGGAIPWITPADLSGYEAKYIERGQRNISYAGLANSGARMLPPGAVLLSSRAPIGYVVIAKNNVTTNQGFKSFVPSEALDSEYLYYYLQAGKDVLVAMASGTTFLELSGKKAAALPIPVAPKNEQRQIVSAVEEILPRLRKSESELNEARARLKTYRAAVLKAACEGRLVPTEAELAPGNDWQTMKIDSLLSVHGLRTGPFGTLLSKEDHQPDGFPVLGIENIGERGFVPGSKIHISEKKAHALHEYRVKPGDVLISRSGTVGEVCVVPESAGDALFSTNIIRVSLDTKAILPSFFCMLLRGSPSILQQLEELCKGSSRTFLNQHILRSLDFLVPAVDTQTSILSEVDRRLSVVEQLEAAIARSLQRAARLRQAILKQAFEGKLVPQDPNDEPASVLLERIRKARAETAGAKSSKRQGPRRARSTGG